MLNVAYGSPRARGIRPNLPNKTAGGDQQKDDTTSGKEQLLGRKSTRDPV